MSLRYVIVLLPVLALGCATVTDEAAQGDLGPGGATGTGGFATTGGTSSGGTGTVTGGSSSGGATGGVFGVTGGTSSGGSASGGAASGGTASGGTATGGTSTGGTSTGGTSTGGTSTGGTASGGTSTGGGSTVGDCGLAAWASGSSYTPKTDSTPGSLVTSVCSGTFGTVAGCVNNMKQVFECKAVAAHYCNNFQPGVSDSWWSGWQSVQQCP